MYKFVTYTLKYNSTDFDENLRVCSKRYQNLDNSFNFDVISNP